MSPHMNLPAGVEDDCGGGGGRASSSSSELVDDALKDYENLSISMLKPDGHNTTLYFFVLVLM